MGVNYPNRQLSFNLYLTEQCNLHCAHCLHECGPAKSHMSNFEVNLSLNIIQKIIEDKSIQVTGIGITGGEPTLHPQFNKITQFLSHIRHNYPQINIELFTNTTMPINVESNPHLVNLFTSVNVGYGNFHGTEQKIQLDQYTKLSGRVSYHRVQVIRTKGRAKKLIEARPEKFQLLYPECIYTRASSIWSVINFGPGKIRFCGENSHEYNNAPGFTDYEETYFEHPELLIDQSIKYITFHTGPRCLTPCTLYLVKDWEKNGHIGSNQDETQCASVQTDLFVGSRATDSC